MITHIQLTNFKTFRDTRIPLAPGITVFVGANNSGKTNALTALKLLSQVARSKDFEKPLNEIGGFESVVARGADSFSLGIQMDDDNASSYVIGWGGLVIRDPMPAKMADVLSHIGVFDFSIRALQAEATIGPNPVLGPDGLDLAAVLDHLANTQPDVIDAVLSEIGPPVTTIKRLLTPAGSRRGTKVVGIQESNGQVFRAPEISDGLLLFIAISIAAHLTSSTRGLIAIEEPERGIHPRRIREVIDQFRRLASRGAQIILTTHSPLVLDEFRDTPEAILIFDRDDEGTHVQRLSDHPEWQEGIMMEVPLGDLWYSGLLGGVPR